MKREKQNGNGGEGTEMTKMGEKRRKGKRKSQRIGLSENKKDGRKRKRNQNERNKWK